MRKFFMLVAIVGLALLMADPSWALDFKFGAEYRVRFYSYVGSVDGGGGTSGPASTFGSGSGTGQGGVQLRVRPRFDVSDDNGNMTATLRLEIGDVEWGNGGGAAGVANGGTNGTNPGGSARVGNGAGGGMDADGVNVETKWGYVDFASPFGVPLRWRAGLQPWYLSKGIVIDNDVAGLRAYGQYSIVSYDFGWYRASSGQCTNTVPTAAPSQNWNNCSTSTTTDNNLDYYQAGANVAVAKWLNPGAYYIYGRNAASANPAVASQQFLGLTVNGDVGFLKYDLDFVFGQQNGGMTGSHQSNTNRINVRGFGVDGGVHIPVGPVLIHAVGSYATGDEQDGGSSEAMPWISPSWNGAGGLYELIGSGGTFDMQTSTQDMMSGLWMVGAGAEYRPVKALWLRFMWGLAGFSTNSANCAFNRAATAVGAACYGPQYRGNGWTQTGTSVNGVAQGVGGMAGQSLLGNEFTLRADWDLWTNFKVQGAMSALVPPRGQTAQKYVLQLYYNF